MKNMIENTLKRLVMMAVGAAIMSSLAWAQTTATQTVARPQRPQLDLAITFTADRTNPVAGNNQWLTGGSIELGADAWHGLGIAAKVTGVTTGQIGTQGVPLNLVLVTFGPRFRYTHKKLSFYGEGLLGEANGFRSVFASPGGATNSANALALQVGGGVDLRLAKHLAWRALEANWTRTQFSNGTSNVQNHLMLGSGLAVKF